MRLIECIHTNSNCYKLKGGYNAQNIGSQPKYGTVYPSKPQGIVIHSTGANNTSIKRYCQPSKTDENYAELIKLIGLNKNNNSWNRGVSKSVHYIIGKLADGSIATVQMLPHDIACWGCGSGKKGSFNYNATAHIQFEVCEDNLTHEDYFRAVYKEATELCAELCKQYSWNESVIVSHHEAYSKGYASNHGDIDHWLKKYGLTMANFRADVKKLLDGVKPSKPIEVGDAVNFTGEKHYTNSGALLGKTAKPCACIVKQIYKLGKAKHPYLVKGASVNGWVNAEDLSKG